MAKIIRHTVTVNSDAPTKVALELLADYLYKQGAIKIQTKWDSTLNIERTHYQVETVMPDD